MSPGWGACNLTLAIARYELAVALGLVLLGIQVVEPAPADAIFAITISVAAVAGDST